MNTYEKLKKARMTRFVPKLKNAMKTLKSKLFIGGFKSMAKKLGKGGLGSKPATGIDALI